MNTIFTDIEHAVKRQYIARAMIENEGLKAPAGRQLGMSRRAIQSWVKICGLTTWKALMEASGIGPLEESWSAACDRQVKERLLAGLERNNWNVSRTAAELGVCTRTMNYKMRKYGWLQPVMKEVYVRTYGV